MYYDNQSDGIGLDLTPLVNAGTSAADSYAKIRAADAAVAAAKRRQAPAPMQVQAGTRRLNPMAYLILGVVVIGGFFVARKFLGKRRR